MQPVRLAAFAATLALTGQTATLGILRATPQSPADPGTEIAITFDRPVAGGLETTIEADDVFTIEPAIPGRFEWRDPMTVRFLPDRPLAPESRYTLTVRAGITAMDGARLERPYTHTFTVAPPTVLGGDPANMSEMARYLPPVPRLRILISSPADEAVFARNTRIRPGQGCAAQPVGVRVVAQRRISEGDPRAFEWLGYRGPWPRDSINDTRRVLEIEPATPLPLDCAARLDLPYDIAASPDSMMSWALHTHGALRIESTSCGAGRHCPTGPVIVTFTTPVRGSEVQRYVHVAPGVSVEVRDTADVSPTWAVASSLAPRRTWTVSVDPALTDIFGQRIGGALSRTMRTTGYSPSVSYEYGRLLVERDGLRTLPVQHVNVDSLTLTTVAIPDSMEAEFLARSWNWEEPWGALHGQARTTTVGVRSGQDDRQVTGVRLPLSTGEGTTLYAVQVSSPQLDSISRRNRPIALVQVTDLAVHARVGLDEALVWVTGVTDGEPRSGARVTLYDAEGRARGEAMTDATGIAHIATLRTFDDDPCNEGWCELEGYVAATLGDDRSVVGITSYDPDLAPWRFGVFAAWQEQRAPQTAALFTERGIYRPGEQVIVKAILRDGPLGDLHAPAGDSVRWIFRDREGGVARDTVVRLGEFGTDDQRLSIESDAPLGGRGIEIQRMRAGEWRSVAWSSYTVAEYRPPEFLVEVNADTRPRFSGDTLTATVAGRYLFGAPMAAAPVRWTVIERPLSPWEIRIPDHEDWRVGVQANWWEDEDSPRGQRESGVDTLDASGQVDLRVPLPATAGGRGSNVTLQAMVTDANRQVVTASASARVHPAAFYLAARVGGDRWFLRAGEPVDFEVVAVTPEGTRVPGVDVTGTIVRREWHRVRRVRNGQVEDIGNWVSDTVATCALRTTVDPAHCGFTPEQGGSFSISFEAMDDAGRQAVTRFPRWASGPGWVPWNDETELKMDIVADREEYAPGDTATLLFASPFTGAEAWITVERERVIESRRIRIEDGATTLRLPITEAHAPNVFVSIVVVRGRSAEPGPLDDPGRPALRVGYTELRVLPDVKRLAVEVTPMPRQSSPSPSPSPSPVTFEPGDTARVALRVTDRAGRGRRSEVTLWAVDVGVLALTGYRTPDPLDLLYGRRGLGMRLASNLVRVAPQVPDGQKGSREAGGGGGGDDAGILRSRFQTTAFFLGSVVTDANGEVTASAKLPDNLTTFRVMAVAVADDRFGSGDAEILVTRPLVARPALPRFLRVGDRFAAGVVVNQRIGGTPEVEVRAEADNVRIRGDRRQEERLEAGRGREFRFDIEGRRERDTPLDPAAPDSAWFRFDASGEGERDAVRLGIPYRVAWHPLSGTMAGIVRDTATASLALHDDVDEDRSRLRISIGTSPLGFIDGARMNLRLYPYQCTEQVSSVALPAIALVQADGIDVDSASLVRTARDAVRTILRRQTPEGGIGYWSALDWTTPWLSAWAGRILLEARDAGIAVDSAALARLADYVQNRLVEDETLRVPVAWWYNDMAARLSERAAAADFLSRYGRPDVAAENVLLSNAGRMRWEDRVLLAEMLQRRGQAQPASALLDQAWSGVRIEGRTATLPEEAFRLHYFQSRVRPMARLLSATLRIRPDDPGLPPLAETIAQTGRAAETRSWNTQDYGWAVLALADYQRVLEGAPPTEVRVRSGRRTLLAGTIAGTATRDTTLSLDGLVRRNGDARSIDLGLESTDGRPVYWFATVDEVPRDLQTVQVDRGIAVERWYETVDGRTPTVTVREGDLVRVRLRITVPAERRFVVVDDPLPAGLEAVDLSLRTLAGTSAFVDTDPNAFQQTRWDAGWYYGSWDAGYWSPFDHREMRDDRVVYSATLLWPGTWTASYLARATTPGTFIAPPVHAEEMYNPGVNGRTAATRFTVEPGR